MSPTDVLQSQWQNPADIFSVLLIIGGEVIQKALAQVAGDFLAPVAFSFGWVAYSFITLMSVVGGGCLMPLPDHPVKVINGENGFCRDNRSWILGRLLRDFEYPLDNKLALHITVFRAVEKGAGKPEVVVKPDKDWLWASGLVTILVQLGIAAIPWGLHKNWGIFLVTVCGTVLALLTGTLPQWHLEKWACRKNTTKKLIVTGGNGTRHVMVILGDGKGLDLEDLASAESPQMKIRIKSSSKFLITQVVCSILAALWIVFLITVVGLQENAWYLLAIGGLGMIQNVVVAGAKRGTGTTGIHLKEIGKLGQRKVMDALMDLEEKYKGVGKSLLVEFFNGPGQLRDDETSWWDGTNKATYDDKRQKNRSDSWELRESFLSEDVTDSSNTPDGQPGGGVTAQSIGNGHGGDSEMKEIKIHGN